MKFVAWDSVSRDRFAVSSSGTSMEAEETLQKMEQRRAWAY